MADTGKEHLGSTPGRECTDGTAKTVSVRTRLPVVSIGTFNDVTKHSEAMTQVAADPVPSITLEGVGHYAALEAPEKLAEALVDFFDAVDTA